MLISLLISIAFAQMPKTPLFPACVDQIKTLCDAATDGRAVVTCLRKNASQLSTDCKLDLERYVTGVRQAAARGGGALGGFGGMTGLTPPLPTIGYEGRYSSDVYENRLNLSSPVAAGEKSITSLTLSGASAHLASPVVLSTGQILPADLYRAEIGSQTTWKLDGGKSIGLRASVGSTGDQVFQSMRDANFSFAFTYGFPGSAAGDYWLALVYFANNSTLGDYIPIPGIVYIHKTERFTGVFGFPILSLQYTPTTFQAYSISILGTTLISEAAFGPVTGTQGFLQLSFNQQRFILHDRAEDRDRLTFEETKIGVGVRAPLFNAAFGELQVGHGFNRKLYIGQKILRAESGLADLDDEAFVNASLKYVF